jgi:hypothetical protein
MAKETSKAMRRRWCEDATRVFPWRELFSGRGIDVGCGDDPLPFDGIVKFDTPDGDANKLSSYFKAGEFQFLHSSQSLEHMHSPDVLFNDWFKVIAPGGAAIITVPSWELYEGMRWPSVYNPDHKSTWSMNLLGSPAGNLHVHVPSWLKRHASIAETVLVRQLAVNYNYRVGVSKDQTWEEADGVEPWIEFVLRKP